MQKGAFTQRHTCKRKIIRKARKPNHVFRGRVGVSTAIYFEVGLKLARCLLTNWIHFFFLKMESLRNCCILMQECVWYSGSFAYLAHRQRSTDLPQRRSPFSVTIGHVESCNCTQTEVTSLSHVLFDHAIQVQSNLH